MTSSDRLLVALAAALAPSRAAPLLARLAAAAALPGDAAARAGAPRAERLGALAAALATSAPAAARVDSEAGERPRVAALLRRLGSGASPPPGVSPLLVRLLRERR